MAAKIKSREDYGRVTLRIEALAQAGDARDEAELVELRDAAEKWDAGQGGEVAGDDLNRHRSERRHNPITAMFDRLKKFEKK
jgi:hypothetical protein